MSQTAKYQIIIFFLSFAIILMGSFGYYRYSSTLGFEKNQSEVLTLIKDNYLREFPDAKKLDEYKIKGEVAALEDPYTQYFTTKEEQKLEADLNQKFFGIGVKLEKVGESFQVVQVLKSGGAESAGVTVAIP